MQSAELYYLPMPFGVEELRAATNELIRRNGLASCYIRPIAFRGYGEMGLFAESPVEVTIATWPWGAYLGEEGKRIGDHGEGLLLAPDLARRADPARQGVRAVPELDPRQDRGPQRGLQEAILLDQRGMVCEGSGENIFVVREGEILTPPHTASILDGINRKSVIQIARDLGYTVVERDIGRSELYLAEEIFLTGTAAELVPVREIDDHPIEAPGEITQRDRGEVRRRPARPRSRVRGMAGSGGRTE